MELDLEGTNGYKEPVADGPILKHSPQIIKNALEEYKWVEDDVLICTAAKCGTHLIWEIVQMLLNNTSQLLDMPKEAAMVDLTPITECSKYLKSPKAINTHFRLDVLSEEFQNRKTITVIRNPKDAAISGFHHMKQIAKIETKYLPESSRREMALEDFLNKVLSESPEKASFWSFHSYMWKKRNDPNMLFLFYEDLVMSPLSEIEKVNDFLGVNRSHELLQEISEATTFENMKKGKEKSERVSADLLMKDDGSAEKPQLNLYRKGKIGDWKNHLTVTQNERFDQFISEWKKKYVDLQFTYE